nr:zinc finger BED domain-containing protein RICESLEEPER 2-like [Ipomoea batatas]
MEPNQDDTTTVNTVVDLEVESTGGTASKGKSKNSEVWTYFIDIGPNEKGIGISQCKGCKTILLSGGKTYGTSTMRRHMKSCKSLKYHFHDIGQMNFDCDGIIRSKKLDIGLAREVFAAAIVEHDCRFAFAEYPGFRKYHKLLNPDAPMISRNTLVSDINNVVLAFGVVLDSRFKFKVLEKLYAKDLDVLDHWKGCVQGFPILSCMACDLLAIPITTVASEFAFSIGARVLTKYRSCLLPEKVQTLICTRNWLHGFNMDDDDVDEGNNGDEGDDMNEDELNDGIGERIASPKEIVDHRSGSPFVAGKPGKKVALCRRLLETVVAEDSPSLPEVGEEVTGLGDGAVGPPLLVVTPTREEDRGRRLLLRSASCYDVRVADDRGMLLHCFAQRRRGASASDAIGYATAIAHWIAMLCFANIGAVRRRRSREPRSPALEVTVGSPPL